MEKVHWGPEATGITVYLMNGGHRVLSSARSRASGPRSELAMPCVCMNSFFQREFRYLRRTPRAGTSAAWRFRARAGLQCASPRFQTRTWFWPSRPEPHPTALCSFRVQFCATELRLPTSTSTELGTASVKRDFGGKSTPIFGNYR